MSLKTPLARQSIGLSGFRTTIGRPGLAHVTVNATRPSITAGIGPARATLAKNPSVALTSRFVAVGVTTKPLLWARVGPAKIKVPGQLQPSTGRRWYDEIDDQWTPYYQRRPPSVSAQLHEIIAQMEGGAVSAAKREVAIPRPHALAAPTLPASTVRAHRKACRKQARQKASVFSLRRRQSAKREAMAQHQGWVIEQQEALSAEHQRLTALVDNTMKAWMAGDPATVYVVTNALLSANEAPGALVSLVDGVATLLVFAPALEDVHPSGPAFSAGGAPTVKKRSKSERQRAHWTLCGASTLHVLTTVRTALRGVNRAEVVVATMSSSTGDLGDSPVIASFTVDPGRPARHLGEMLAIIGGGVVARPKALRAVLGDGFVDTGDAPAIAVLAESSETLASPDFWLEVATAADAIRTAPSSATSKPVSTRSSPAVPSVPSPRAQQAKGRSDRRSIPLSHDARMSGLLEELSYVDDEATALAHWSVVEQAFTLLRDVEPGQVTDEVVTELLLTLSVCAGSAERVDLARELVDHAARLNVAPSVHRTLQAFAAQREVRAHESALRQLLVQAEVAVRSADENAVVGVLNELIRRLPDTPTGADDEAEEVARALVVPAAALRLTEQRDELTKLLSSCGPEVQRRLTPLAGDLDVLLCETEQILEFIEANPGLLQSGLAETLGLDKSRVRELMWHLAHFAKVTRVKRGNSYLVSIDEETIGGQERGPMSDPNGPR